MVAIYDYLLTIAAEVNIWRSPVSASTVIFLLNRYLALVVSATIVAASIWNQFMCTKGIFVSFEVATGLMILSQAGVHDLSIILELLKRYLLS